MGKDSKIEWTDHTMNFWWGCEKVSPACTNCYAEALSARFGHDLWGRGKPRMRTSEKNWREPYKWDRKAKASGVRARVFTNSMADFFDAEVSAQWRADALKVIAETPNLDWLVLTKRPELIIEQLDAAGWANLPINVWIGTTVENQAMANKRIPHLLAPPARVRFLSMEPLLGPVDLNFETYRVDSVGRSLPLRRVDWVIVGGESGPGSRPMHPDWAVSLQRQCSGAGVPFHFKQWGEHNQALERVGKKVAGRLLGGRTWDELPAGDAA